MSFFAMVSGSGKGRGHVEDVQQPRWDKNIYMHTYVIVLQIHQECSWFDLHKKATDTSWNPVF